LRQYQGFRHAATVCSDHLCGAGEYHGSRRRRIGGVEELCHAPNRSGDSEIDLLPPETGGLDPDTFKQIAQEIIRTHITK